jgi:hypothetical protein
LVGSMILGKFGIGMLLDVGQLSSFGKVIEPTGLCDELPIVWSKYEFHTASFLTESMAF